MTNLENNILLLHLIRCPSLRKRAAAAAGVFDDTLPMHKSLWGIVQRLHALAPDERPARMVMDSELATKLDPDNQDEARKFLDEAYGIPEADLMPTVAERYFDAARIQQMKTRWNEKLHMLYSPAEINSFINGIGNDMSSMATASDSLSQPMLRLDKYLFVAPRFPTGVKFWDEMAGGGFTPGEVVGVLGPTGGGKTTMAVQTAIAQAQHRKNMLLVLYEQPPQGDVTERLVASALGVTVDRIRNRNWSDLEPSLQIGRAHV